MKRVNGTNVYDISEFGKLLAKLDLKTVRNNKKITYYNIAAAFDIETTSWTEGEEKRACMYIWTFALDDIVVMGRTWAEFKKLAEMLTDTLQLYEDKRLVIYVHNLAYEMQFIRKHFEWYKVFATDLRKPLYAVTETGIEFRCSYLLSGYSLATLARNLTRHKIAKLSGDLEYNMMRNSLTAMTDDELSYCINDVLIVTAYIKECIEDENGFITRIPLTKTSYVRRFCRNRCLEDNKPKGCRRSREAKKYHELIKSLTLDITEYLLCRQAFQGGFTHANFTRAGRLFNAVISFDICSSYPAVMLSEEFPMSKGEAYIPENESDFYYQLKTYCCIFEIEFTEIEATTLIDHPIAAEKCYVKENYNTDNGRLIDAERIEMCITNVDFEIITAFYTWKNIRIGKFYRYRKHYLPKLFIESILELYEKKTTLKGVAGKEIEYMSSKAMLNSCYGMAVTSVSKPQIIYTDNWEEKPPDFEKDIASYNRSFRRFLFYPWGIFVTAYARKNLLLGGILPCGTDYIYADTDSVKIINAEKHREVFEVYNRQIIHKLEKAMKYHGIPFDKCCPRTVKGEEKMIGIYEKDAFYSKFKTLGAKRYMYEEDGKINITVSGLNKKITVPYLLDTFSDPFEAFTDGLYIPKGYTGKNIHTFIDEPFTATLTDYMGNTMKVSELSAIHLDESDYSLSLGEAYLKLLKGISEGRRLL